MFLEHQISILSQTVFPITSKTVFKSSSWGNPTFYFSYFLLLFLINS